LPQLPTACRHTQQTRSPTSKPTKHVARVTGHLPAPLRDSNVRWPVHPLCAGGAASIFSVYSAVRPPIIQGNTMATVRCAARLLQGSCALASPRTARNFIAAPFLRTASAHLVCRSFPRCRGNTSRQKWVPQPSRWLAVGGIREAAKVGWLPRQTPLLPRAFLATTPPSPRSDWRARETDQVGKNVRFLLAALPCIHSHSHDARACFNMVSRNASVP